MYSLADLPDTIPVFPLSGALLLPRGKLPLRIFEPRYLSMLDDALKTRDRLIGIVQPTGDGETLHDVGCVGRVTQFSEHEGGRYGILLTGISRFRIIERLEGFTPYINCRVDWNEFHIDLTEAALGGEFDRDNLLKLLARYFEHEDLKTDWSALNRAEDEALVNSLSMLCPFEPEDKQALLEAPDLSQRRDMIETLLEFATRGGKSEDRMQ